MNYRRYLSAVLLIPLFSTWTMAQTAELSPEELDAAFTAEDAAREAAGWSDKIIERPAVDPLASMSAEADLVIRATVIAQEVAYDDNDIPFTHTTFSVNEVLEGSYADSQITVVQEGGPLKEEPKNVLMLSHTHYFMPGQEELLFLELNPNSSYPYSQVVIKNRFGVVNGKVFNENGRGMIYTETAAAPGYKLSWSKDRNPNPRFSEFKIGSHEFSKQFTERDHRGEQPDQPVSRQQQVDTRPGYESGVDISTFKHALNRHGG